MRVAIDVRKINDFGIGTYLRNLVRFLPQLDSPHRFHLLCYRRHEALLQSLASDVDVTFIQSGNYSIREHLEIPMKLRRIRADLYHAPHYVLPYGLPCPSVVTVHDVIHLLFPQYLPSRFAGWYAKQMIGHALKKARIVMTVSSASKKDLLRLFDVSDEKIRVIPNAIDPSMTQSISPEDLATVRKRLQLTGRFILFVGNIKPHKNVERLIEAFGALRAQDAFSDLSLIAVGDDISRYPALRRAMARHKVRDHVRFFGFVPESTLVALYQSAHLFVFPSLYEGFGLPPLEAMANGLPVVTSNVSSLPEVVGDAALTADPRDIGALTDAMRRLLVDEELREKLKRRGYEQASKFSWERAVRQVHDVYESALA